MRRYRVIRPIILGFLTPQDQHNLIIEPENGTILESDGQTIWLIKNEKRRESITTANAIKCWLKQGAIARIKLKEGH